MKSAGMLDTLRCAVRESDLPQAEIARRLDVSPALICKFLSGETDMGAVSLDKLADVLGLRLVPARKRRSTKR